MKNGSRAIIANLIGIVLLCGGSIWAQQFAPVGEMPMVGQPNAALSSPAMTSANSWQQFAEESVVQQPSMLSEGSVGLDGATYGAAPTGPGCVVCGDGDGLPPSWYTDQQVRVLSFSGTRRKILTQAIVPSGAGFVTIGRKMTTRSAIFDVAAGYHGTLGHYLGRDSENRNHFLEFSYWGLNNWRESRQVVGNRLPDTDLAGDPQTTFGLLISPFPWEIGGFNRADTHEIAYQADIHNYELSLWLRPHDERGRLVLRKGRWRRECKPGDYVSYMFGFRVLSLDESFDFTSRGLIIPVNPLGTAPVSGDYHSTTHNDLIGLQFGIDYTVRRCKWSWGLRMKASPMINFCDYEMSAVSNSLGIDPIATDEVNFRRGGSKDEAAFLGSLGFHTSYKIRPNIVLRASFDMDWVVGLARAPEQLRFDREPPANTLNPNGHIFVQGISLGAEWQF